MRHSENVFSEANQPCCNTITAGTTRLKTLEHHGYLESLSDERTHVGIHGLQGETSAETKSHQLVPCLPLRQVALVLADHERQPSRHGFNDLQIQDAGGIKSLDLRRDELSIQIAEFKVLDELTSLFQQRPLFVHGLAGHEGEVVEEVCVVKVLVWDMHFFSKTPSNHFAHDLPVKCGKMNHVEIKDQVEMAHRCVADDESAATRGATVTNTKAIFSQKAAMGFLFEF